MTAAMKLVPNHDGSYDLLLQYDKLDTEFSMDFFSRGQKEKSNDSISKFLTKNYKNIKIKTVKLMAAGIIIASIPFASFLSSSAAEANSKYSMTYLYGGTVSQQIEYVERTNNSLQTVSPSYFDINTDGSLKLNTVSTELVNRMHANGIKVVPFLSNHWDRTAGINALNDVETLSTQIANYVSLYNLDGVNVDIENVTHTEKSQYTELVRLLRQKIPAHKEVSIAVAANPKNWQTGWHGSYDYTALAQNSDYLMMMTYDEHYEGGTAGPVASIGFVENSIKYALSNTTADKIVVGLPFFGRIWSTNDTSVTGKGLGISTINSMIKEYNAVVTFDAASQSPKAEFEVKTGDKQFTVGGKALAPGKYVIWYENDQSIQAKLNLVNKYDLKGAGSWALGQEDTSIWNNYNTWLNGETSFNTTQSYPSSAGDASGWRKDSIGWWLKTDGNTYAKNEWKFVNNAWYFFNDKGYMETGWVSLNNTWYYLKDSGAMTTGWLFVHGKWYFLSPQGDMATGWISDNGKRYFLNPNGDMATNWLYNNGKWYYLNSNGAMATGWLFHNNNRYFLNSDGDMATGWLYNNDKWFFLNPNGAMATGWVLVNGIWYYLKEAGDMTTEPIVYKGKEYYFNQSGACINP